MIHEYSPIAPVIQKVFYPVQKNTINNIRTQLGKQQIITNVIHKNILFSQ